MRIVRGRSGRTGFTLVELTVVLVIVGLMLSMAGFFLTAYLGRASSRRAAQLFSRDLAQARAFAARSREPVTVRFHEDSLAYTVEARSGRTLARRRFQPQDEISLSALDLELSGDTLHFDGRGLADLPGLGAAAFTAGVDVYEVRFNGTGTSRVVAR